VKLFRNYFFWAYERGSFHYDIMVTLILLFIFVSPHFINFRAAPVPHIPLAHSEVLVRDAGTVSETTTRFIYTIRAEDLAGANTDEDRRARALGIIEPVAGYVRLEGNIKPLTDANGKLIAYEATVLR
jgi:hypothetical protein